MMNEDRQDDFMNEIKDFCRIADNGKKLQVGSRVVSIGKNAVWHTGETGSTRHFIDIGTVKSVTNDSVDIEITASYTVDPKSGLPNAKNSMRKLVKGYPCDCCDSTVEEEMRSEDAFTKLADIVF